MSALPILIGGGEAAGARGPRPLAPKPPTSCAGCTLFSAPGRVKGIRNPTAEVLLLGEAPGETEVREGMPFVGAAGYELEKVLGRAGLDKDQFVIANTLMCRPPLNDMEKAGNALAHCSQHLSDFIDQHPRVKTIIALGNTALSAAHPSWRGVARYRGWWTESHWNIPLLATFHPSYLLPRRGQPSSTKWVGVAIRDIQRAVAGRPPVLPTRYILDPSPSEALLVASQALATSPSHVAYDLETIIKQAEKGDPDTLPDGSGILRISFSWTAGVAMSIPWHSSYNSVISLLLSSPLPKATWNGWNFDNRVLETTAFTINGDLHDGMVAWHVLWPNLPKSLEFVASHYCSHLQPWKHLSHTDFARYSAIDSDATWVIARDLKSELSA